MRRRRRACVVKADLSFGLMQASPQDPAQALSHALSQVRLDNALALFEEFVRATARHADAATLRGLERRFAERVQIQPSYWSQIKGRSRQIGERLARPFEHLCHKPGGWMDMAHGASTVMAAGADSPRSAAGSDESAPRDDDERFIVGLVLTYYRRHPQRARMRLLDLLGEVLSPTPASSSAPAPSQAPATPAAMRRGAAVTPPHRLAPAAEDAHALWLRTQTGVAPIKRKR